MGRLLPKPTRFLIETASSSYQTFSQIQAESSLAYLEWVQNLQRTHWPEAQVNEELEQKMASAFKTTYEKSKSLNVSMRDGALTVAVERVSSRGRDARDMALARTPRSN